VKKKSSAGCIVAAAVSVVAVVAVVVGLWVWISRRNIEKQAELCADSTKTLGEVAKSGDSDTFVQLVQIVLSSCSTACDGNDEPSCKRLDDAIGPLCRASSGMCSSLCTKVESPSLKKASCAQAAKSDADKPAPSTTPSTTPASTPPYVYVWCEGAPAKGYNCQVTHKSGATAGNACWDLKVTCDRGVVVGGHACQTVSVGQKATRFVGPNELSQARSCRRVQNTAVENVTVRAVGGG
jgi:hypothetical protein